jgi:adenylosuccinate synthase
VAGVDVLLVPLAGELCAGKTTLAHGLSTRLGADVLSARSELRRIAGRALDRRALQQFGAEVDEQTAGLWLVDAVREIARDGVEVVIVDAVRTLRQLDALRSYEDWIVAPVYLSATPLAREKRFQVRGSAEDRGVEFTEVSAHRTEQGARSLQTDAQLAIDTSALTAEGVLQVVLSFVAVVGAVEGS